MKLQNFIIIFLIICIPIILIFSYYLNLEADTIRMKMEYDEKLIESSKEALEAFQINTTEWNSEFNTLANAKRRDILSSINVFTTSLSNKLGISGSSKENILSYVPAIVYIMYDGYYIYSPTYVPKTITDKNGVQIFYYDGLSGDNRFTISPTQSIDGVTYAGTPIYEAESGNGNSGTYKITENNEEQTKNFYYTTVRDKAVKEYKHVLKTFIPYTTKTTINGKDYVINYTLDNYVRIYGKDVQLEGYLYVGETVSSKGITYMTEDGKNIDIIPDYIKLKEYIAFKDKMEDTQYHYGEFTYVYNSNGEKRYYDGTIADGGTDRFFTVSKNGIRNYLPTVKTEDAETEVWVPQVNEGNYNLQPDYYSRDRNAEYMKIIYEFENATGKMTKGVQYILLNRVYSNDGTGTRRNLFRYQLNNGIYTRTRYVLPNTDGQGASPYIYYYTADNTDPTDYYKKDRNARNYFCEMRDFERQVAKKIFNKDDFETNTYTQQEIKQTFEDILKARKDCIINNIKNNLNLSIANYSANSKIDYKFPNLTDADWEQAISNISTITFLQGMKIGLKTYNNYSVVTSSFNNEFTSEDGLYYIDVSENTDGYYHKFGCSEIKGETIEAYKNLDFTVSHEYETKDSENKTEIHSYYRHQHNGEEYKPCYYCIINENKMNKITYKSSKTKFKKYLSAMYSALGRENAVQMYRTMINKWW